MGNAQTATADFMTPQNTCTHEEALCRLRLLRSENVGPISFMHLINRYKTAKNALNHVQDHAVRGGRSKPLVLCKEEVAHEEQTKTKAFGAHFLYHDDNAYPECLRAIHDPPPILIYKGNLAHLSRHAIGIVGARNASLNGRKFAKKLAHDLSAQGYAITSGLARGIDAAAHEGSLDHATIACVAGGIDTIYPPENKTLFEAVIQQGLLISETPFGIAPQAHYFPRRNRLICGISRGLVVVEAALKSGSLITSRLALEQGREVFAVPGSPLDPRCQGTNGLIQKGATLVQSANDIIQALQNQLFKPLKNDLPLFQESVSENISDHDLLLIQKEILINLSPSPICIDELLRECHFSSAVVALVLLELELAGRITRLPGNQVVLNIDC